MTANSLAPADILVAQRILVRPDEFTRWEAHHDFLMRAVSSRSQLPQQMVALRATALSLVHRKALFEYLRQRQIAGAQRRKLLAVFYGCADYTNAVLVEHGNYVRSSSSYLCTRHLAEQLMHDPALDEPLALYEEWYAEYFHAFCDVELAETEEERQACLAQESLKPLLKHRVTEARKAILAMPQTQREWREVRIRRCTGDTQRLRALALIPKQ
ncbi:MAG TPA: hypothetical protein VLV25_09095 [Steroidobacteraceae bacterium]|nr:hypothetical protein [Steroidobacteraceae bacterium]